jgi:hypothetical protein
MDFFEAMKHMKEGKKVKLKSWSKDRFIGIKEDRFKVFGKEKVEYSVLDSTEMDLSPVIPFSILVKKEWELFKEDENL